MFGVVSVFTLSGDNNNSKIVVAMTVVTSSLYCLGGEGDSLSIPFG
jgi:hypothetical protein